MDDIDRERFWVLGTFAACLAAVIVGYLLAWRSKRSEYRKVGSLVTAAVVGLAGIFMSMWLIGAIMPLPPPDGSPLWEPLVALLVFSPLPLGAFYLCARFARQAMKDERSLRVTSGSALPQDKIKEER